MIIFKPGYGVFPRHSGSEPKLGYGTIPEDKYVTIKLPKLETREERINNLSNLWLGSGVPEGKFILFENKKKSEIKYLDRRN